jgi:hypothetical protein
MVNTSSATGEACWPGFWVVLRVLIQQLPSSKRTFSACCVEITAASTRTGKMIADNNDWTEFAENVRKARMHAESLGVLEMVGMLSLFA